MVPSWRRGAGVGAHQRRDGQKLNHFGHVKHNSGLERTILEGIVAPGRRGKAQPSWRWTQGTNGHKCVLKHDDCQYNGVLLNGLWWDLGSVKKLQHNDMYNLGSAKILQHNDIYIYDLGSAKNWQHDIHDLDYVKNLRHVWYIQSMF